MAIHLTLVGLGNGRARIEDHDGRPLEVDGEVVEVTVPSGASAAESPSEEMARLRAENARMSQESAAHSRADARQRAGRRTAMGLDRASLRALIAKSYEGARLLGKLDRGELSWHEVEQTADALASAAGR